MSGVDAPGVRLMVSVVDCPGASDAGARPVSDRPEESELESAMLFRATLPTLVIVMVSLTETPGVVLTDVGLADTVTASISGTVNVSV